VDGEPHFIVGLLLGPSSITVRGRARLDRTPRNFAPLSLSALLLKLVPLFGL
jgi:hypothetical protein